MDYQINALYGDSAGNGSLNAAMLNPYAAGPDDWQTILTSGMANTALYGLNGWINNQLQAGVIENQQTAQQISVRNLGNGFAINGSLIPFLVLGLVAYAVLK